MIYPNLASLIDDSAADLTRTINAIHATPTGGACGDGRARIVLTGGTAGIALLERLAATDLRTRIDWSRVELFFGDERNVEVSHPDSNEGQARDALLSHIDIPEQNIHGYGLDGGPMDEAVARYRDVLAEVAPGGFDVHLLGMGGEGHINSLFPHTDAVREREELVVAVTDSPKPPAQRATLTLPAVHAADHVWLLISGEGKAEAAAHAMDPATDPVSWPAAGARGRVETRYYLTQDAAPAE